MIYRFSAHGHPNILATHKTTLEFTKDTELSLKGDCIVGVKADFELAELKKFIQKFKSEKITIIIKIKTQDGKFQEEINAELNPNFNSGREMVVRKTDFVSERTFAIRADKAACGLDRKLIYLCRQKNTKINIEVHREIMRII